ncbi:hypothetical protein [Enterocloster citroniae]|uniref:hypothetical protein n=1 Tax=Enterocloster citroniae TaxID=358743 RepID=UPI00349E4E91
MTRERKIQIMMELLDEQAVSIPAYLEEDYQRAINAAFQKIEKLEIREGVRVDKKTDPCGWSRQEVQDNNLSPLV